MNLSVAYPPRPVRRGRVIALHCSGADAGQWRYLGEALGGGYELLAPEHYGCESTGPWTGGHAFTLADEAARSIALINECEGKAHLVGHSYQGLSHLLPACRLLTVDGAGHMGPLTHAPEVSALVVHHIAAAEAESDASPPGHWRPRCSAHILGAASPPTEPVS